MRYRFTLLTLLAIGLLTSACATAGGGSRDVDRTEPPTMVRGPQPDWRLPSTPPKGMLLDLRVEVRVDSAGQPDIETLRVTGQGSTENQEAVRAWIRNATFQPASQAGRPVPGVFKTRIMLKAAVRRAG